MTRVVWQACSQGTYEAFRTGRVERSAKGGTAYEFQAMRVLAGHTDFDADPHSVRGSAQGALNYLWALNRSRPPADIVFKDQRIIAIGRLGVAPVEVGVVHHIDYTLRGKSFRYRLYIDRLLKRLPKLTAVVAVSRFWEAELRKAGCRDVEVIYNAFDPAEFEVSDAQVDAFLGKFGLQRDRPIVYLGSAGPQKGVVEAYAALKDEGYTLLMTGREGEVKLPVRTLLLERSDFLCLLKVAGVVVTMSTLLEGWNRVAHEAMLSRTPVVGSGSAGMGELLAGGGQLIQPTPVGLAAAVRAALSRRAELGARGREFVQRFDLPYFDNAWIQLINRLAGKH